MTFSREWLNLNLIDTKAHTQKITKTQEIR